MHPITTPLIPESPPTRPAPTPDYAAADAEIEAAWRARHLLGSNGYRIGRHRYEHAAIDRAIRDCM